MAHSSSGLGRRPLKAEITGSNPVCATVLRLDQSGRGVRFAHDPRQIQALWHAPGDTIRSVSALTFEILTSTLTSTRDPVTTSGFFRHCRLSFLPSVLPALRSSACPCPLACDAARLTL